MPFPSQLTPLNTLSQTVNALATATISSFSLNGMIRSELKKTFAQTNNTTLYFFTAPLILNLFLITWASYDGDLSEIIEFLKKIKNEPNPQVRHQQLTTFISGSLSGATKGISCFIAMYLILQPKLGKPNSLAISGLVSFFYALNQKLKITDAYHKALNNSQFSYCFEQACWTKKLDLTGHFLGEMTPAWILTTVFMLSFNKQPSKAAFALQFFIGLLLGINLGVGTTTQYAIDYLKPENEHDIINNNDIEQNISLSHFNQSTYLLKTSRLLSVVGVLTKSLLAFHSTVLLCGVFNHLSNARFSLNINDFKELEKKAFEPA